jgi:hypothetical protein
VVFGPGALAEPMLTVARLGIILLLAHASYHLVELPVRRGALGRLWRRPAGRLLVPAAVALVALFGLQLLRLGAVDQPGVAVDAGPDRSLAPLDPASATPAPTPATSSAAALPAPFTPPVKVAVFGDSQGMTLLLNKPADASRYVSLSDQSIEGCGVLTDRIVSRSGERRDMSTGCASWLASWTSRAKATHPQVALVMTGAWDVFDRAGPGTVLPFGTPGWDAHYSTALAAGIAALRGAGAQVALALLPCYRPVPAKGSGFWPERGDDARTRHLNDLLRALAAADPRHVFTIEPPARFCGDLAGNRAYRWDGVHYYKPGSALYLQTAIPQLLAVPGPGS